MTDADVLALAVEIGLLDAPHLRGNAAARGRIVTRMIGGACLAVDPIHREPIAETERVAQLLPKPRLRGPRSAEQTKLFRSIRGVKSVQADLGIDLRLGHIDREGGIPVAVGRSSLLAG